MTKALVIVAHPDDEIIWMGGFILRNKDWKWTILSLCRAKDKDRMPRFLKVCKMINARGYICDLDDTEEGYYKKITYQDIEERIMELEDNDFDYIFTHNSNGEYGHIRHKEINKAVTKMIDDGKLRCKYLYYFSYKMDGEKCIADEKAEKYIKLTDKELNSKKNLIVDVYGFSKGGFEEVTASNAEAFSVRMTK